MQKKRKERQEKKKENLNLNNLESSWNLNNLLKWNMKILTDKNALNLVNEMYTHTQQECAKENP